MVIVNGYSANDSVLVYLIFMQRELRSRLSTHYGNQKRPKGLFDFCGGGTWTLFGLKAKQFGGRRLEKSKTSFRFSLGSYAERTFGSCPSTYCRNKYKARGLILISVVGVLGLEPRTLRV